MRTPVSAVSGDTTLEIAMGDILRQPVDAIVIPTNNFVNGVTGELNQAMRRAAGPEVERETRQFGYCHRGQAVITTGGNLPAKRIIHTPGPVWRGGKENEDYYLASCYVRSLQLADREGLESMAFAAIAQGGHYFPVDRAAQVALKAVAAEAQLATSVKKVRFMFVDEDWFDAYAQILTHMDDPNRDITLSDDEKFMRVITAPLDTLRFTEMIAPGVELDKTMLKLAQPRRECPEFAEDPDECFAQVIYDRIPLPLKDRPHPRLDPECMSTIVTGGRGEDILNFSSLDSGHPVCGFELALTRALVHHAQTGPGGAPWLAASEAAFRRALHRSEHENPGPRLFALNHAVKYVNRMGFYNYRTPGRDYADFGWY